MTGPSEVDPAVLAGEPASAPQLEGGDDDLPLLDPDQDDATGGDGTSDRTPPEPGSA